MSGPAPTRRPISAVLIARNEEQRIGACLESLAFADEIVVVESGSTDRTVEVARRFTDRVVTLPWRGFGPQKQAAVALASHDLVLNVDCDERVPPALAREIGALQSAPTLAAAYAIPRRTFIGEKEIRFCGWSPDRIVRLFDRTRAGFTDDLVHETVVARGEVGTCREALLHHSFGGFGDLLAKLDRYSDLAARQMHERGRRPGALDALRPAFAFFRTYVLRLGFLDGFEGLEIAVADAMGTFAKYAKLRELWRAGARTRTL
ncbi:MAG TPA: glycosyltransferase family 2 protein [Anaeromyxobacter sp.]|nr:glycosyltransferase family 2 protein [Anaeromyxobacter sp.]